MLDLDIQGLRAIREAFASFRRARAVRFIGRWSGLLTLAAILLPVTFHPPYLNGPAIRSDGVGYHLWTRAILEDDFTFCKWNELRQVGAISYVDPTRGVCQDKYPPGLALLRLPFMLPLVDLRPGAPVISPAEHKACLILGAVTLLLVSWFIVASSNFLNVPAWASNFSVLVFVFGTGLFHYSTYDSSFTHIYSALGAALLAWLWLRERCAGRPVPSWAVAVACFFLVAIRNTNLLLLAFLFAADLFVRWRENGTAVALQHLRRHWPAMVSICAAVLMQLAYGYYATHRISYSTYGEERFIFARPLQGSVLFSYERGLFTYYPVVAVGLFAGLRARRTRLASVWLLGLVAGFVTLYGFWWNWYLGGGMGHRGFVELMPLLAIVFAVALPDLRPRVRNLAVVAALLFSFATVELMIGYWYGTVPIAGSTRTVYWRNVVGRYSLLHEGERSLLRRIRATKPTLP